MPSATATRESFFLIYACVLMALIFAGFGSHAMVNTEVLPPVSPVVIFHATFMLSWFSLFIIQAGLIRKRQAAFHQRLGMASIFIAAGVVVSGILIMISGYERTGDFLVMSVNCVSLACFAVLYVLAIARRKQADSHKRLILMSSLALMSPAFGRLCHAAGIHDIFAMFMWTSSLIPLILYDMQRWQRMHVATAIGSMLILIGIAVIFMLGYMDIWSGNGIALIGF